MKSDPWKYDSNWYTEFLFTRAEVDAIMAAVAVLTSDPIAPAKESAWILKTSTEAIPDGTPMGLLLALTYQDNTGSATTYQFSYKTKDEVTHRLLIA